MTAPERFADSQIPLCTAGTVHRPGRMTHHVVNSRPPITALRKVRSALMLAASHKRHSRNAHAVEFYKVFPK